MTREDHPNMTGPLPPRARDRALRTREQGTGNREGLENSPSTPTSSSSTPAPDTMDGSTGTEAAPLNGRIAGFDGLSNETAMFIEIRVPRDSDWRSWHLGDAAQLQPVASRSTEHRCIAGSEHTLEDHDQLRTIEHRHGTALTISCDQCGTSWRHEPDAPQQCPDCLDHLGEPLDQASRPVVASARVSGLDLVGEQPVGDVDALATWVCRTACGVVLPAGVHDPFCVTVRGLVAEVERASTLQCVRDLLDDVENNPDDHECVSVLFVAEVRAVLDGAS